MIKNYTSKTTTTFDKIQKILATHKAKRLMFEYDNQGRIDSLSFSLEVDGREIGFKLPAKVEKVEQIFKREGIKLDDKGLQQAYRTAWANIRDWLDAQMALIDTDQVQAEEVFLPYAINNKDGRTYFETIKENQYLLSESNEGDKDE